MCGPYHRLQEVHRVLGRLNNFTLLTSDDMYDGDDESESDVDDIQPTYKSDSDVHVEHTDNEDDTAILTVQTDSAHTDTDYNLSDDTICYIPETELDSDSTKLDTNCILHSDSTRLDSDTTNTRPDKLGQQLSATPLLNRPDNETSTDTTPLLIRTNTGKRKRQAIATRIQHTDGTHTPPLNRPDNDGTSTDTTPLLIQTNAGKRK